MVRDNKLSKIRSRKTIQQIKAKFGYDAEVCIIAFSLSNILLKLGVSLLSMINIRKPTRFKDKRLYGACKGRG